MPIEDLAKIVFIAISLFSFLVISIPVWIVTTNKSAAFLPPAIVLFAFSWLVAAVAVRVLG